MRELRAERLEGDDCVEQAHAIRAVHDDNLGCLSIRGRRCTTGRSAVAPELWQTPHGKMGRENGETFVKEEG
jgi:hypothetical protein